MMGMSKILAANSNGNPGRLAALAMAMGAAALASVASMPSQALAASTASASGMSVSGAPDRIVLRDGRVLEGTIVEETSGSLSIKLLISGIQSQTATVFSMSDVLRVERAAVADPAPAATTTTRPRQPGGSSGGVVADENATRVYHMRLSGEFAEDISQTPVRQAVEDAARQRADVIIVEVDNEWQSNQFQKRAEDEHAFDEFWRANEISPIFTNELGHLFPGGRPRVVMWVKNAMGGAAFLPFLSREIYFAPEGRMGGIGDLDTYFEGANEWFAHKQQSLRLAAARGIALQGGYDSKLIDAMCLREYVLSVSYESGRPEFSAGLPRPERNEELLTDDGEGENEDTDAEIIRGTGNDNLTLHADLAQKLNVSRGTVSTLDDLLFELGIERNHVIVSDRADRIMDDWSTGIDQAIRTFQRIWNQELPEARAAEGAGDWESRNRARGRQKSLIGSLIGLLNKYKEVLDPDGGNKAQLEVELEAIRLRSIADRRR